eukprot:7225597-Prymnesium_polylepis.1
MYIPTCDLLRASRSTRGATLVWAGSGLNEFYRKPGTVTRTLPAYPSTCAVAQGDDVGARDRR